MKNFVKSTFLLFLQGDDFTKYFFSSQFLVLDSVEKKKFSLNEKIFRKINCLVTYLVKTLISRNFSQKVWERFSVISTTTVRSQFLRVKSTFFFRQINVFTKEFISRKFLSGERNLTGTNAWIGLNSISHESLWCVILCLRLFKFLRSTQAEKFTAK